MTVREQVWWESFLVTRKTLIERFDFSDIDAAKKLDGVPGVCADMDLAEFDKRFPEHTAPGHNVIGKQTIGLRGSYPWQGGAGAGSCE